VEGGFMGNLPHYSIADFLFEFIVMVVNWGVDLIKKCTRGMSDGIHSIFKKNEPVPSGTLVHLAFPQTALHIADYNLLWLSLSAESDRSFFVLNQQIAENLAHFTLHVSVKRTFLPETELRLYYTLASLDGQPFDDDVFVIKGPVDEAYEAAARLVVCRVCEAVRYYRRTVLIPEESGTVISTTVNKLF
jgi:hypothetical protein